MSNETKLAELRSKTDRELLVLIRRELERGIALANVAAGSGSPFHGQAEQTYRKVCLLLLKSPEMNRGERARIEATLRELRSLLDDAPTIERVERNSASMNL